MLKAHAVARHHAAQFADVFIKYLGCLSLETDFPGEAVPAWSAFPGQKLQIGDLPDASPIEIKRKIAL